MVEPLETSVVVDSVTCEPLKLVAVGDEMISEVPDAAAAVSRDEASVLTAEVEPSKPAEEAGM